MKNDDCGVQPREVFNMQHHAHVSVLIDKVDTMQKSRLRGPSTFHSVFKGPRFISNTLRPRSEPRKAVPSLNVPTCAFFETIWSQGNWSSKRLTWNILYNDKVETVFAINYGTQFSKKNSSIQNGSIAIGRSYSRIVFLGLRKGTPPLNHSFVPKNGGTTIWEKNKGKTQAFYFSKDALV